MSAGMLAEESSRGIDSLEWNQMLVLLLKMHDIYD